MIAKIVYEILNAFVSKCDSSAQVPLFATFGPDWSVVCSLHDPKPPTSRGDIILHKRGFHRFYYGALRSKAAPMAPKHYIQSQVVIGLREE